MKTQQPEEQLNRGEFLRSLGMSSAALMAFYCMGTLTSCSSKGTDPAPSGGTGTGTGTGTTVKSGGDVTVLSGNADNSKGAISFIIDLSNAANSPLTSNGGYMYANNIIVAKTTGGSYIAVAKACTHQGTTIIYKSDEANLFCPNHESRFNDSGTVKSGVAPKALQAFKTSLSTDGKQLTITA